MSDEAGYHISPKTKYYVETTTVVEHETIKNSDLGFVIPFGKDWEHDGKSAKDKSSMMNNDFLDFINRASSSNVELEENREKNNKVTLLKEKVESHKENKDEENTKKHEEHTYVLIEKYNKTPEKKKGIIRKIKEKLPHGHKKVEEEHVGPPIPTAVTHTDEGEHKGKRNIFEKIKEKIPRHHS
ncbi:hypothetical protein L1887_16198 [Cichorium endivia]|nr:hypothetical protein L1887_16198 [Cichorium endivia]